MIQNRMANVSTGRLLSGIFSDAEDLVQQQFALFKHEIKDELREARKAFLPVISGAALLLLGAFMLCFTLVYVLDYATVMPLWACFAIVTALLGVGGGVTLAVGLQRLRELPPVAEEAVDELKENVRWLTKPN